jgi:integrase
MLAGIARVHGTAPSKKAALTIDLVYRLLGTIPANTVRDKRDRALIALGFAGAFRCGELLALNTDDIEEVPAGILVTIRKSKTDQEGAGQTIAIPTGKGLKPYETLKDYLTAAGITEGPIFRRIYGPNRVTEERLGDFNVSLIVRKAARAAGLNEREFSAHSLRSGFVTSAVDAGADVKAIQRVTRHKDVGVLVGYVNRRTDFENHAGASFL